jgi:hypothetical protein
MAEKTQEELLKELDNLKAENDTLKKGQETAMEVIGELKAKLDASENAPKTDFVTAKVGKDTYEILVPTCRIKGTVFTARELSKDTEALKYLIEEGSEALRKKA